MEHETPKRDGADIPSSENTDASVPGSGCEEGELAEQKKAYADLNEKFLRLAADFENYRKRTARDREAFTALATEQFAYDILEVVDNIDRALKADDSHLREGVGQIQLLLASILQNHGITPIDSLKKKFDPAEHEAIAHIPSPEASGTVVDEVSRGYRMKDKVIRYAKVAVSKGNESNSEA